MNPTRRMKPVEMLPTLITLGNLFCGFLAIAYLTDSNHLGNTDPVRLGLYQKPMWCILLAMIFDAIDGKIARMVGVASDFGAQIDSLSDVISFGAAPALLFKVMAETSGVVTPKAALVLAVVYVACAALRLARFNVETDVGEEHHRHFKGLPSPAAAACVLALGFLNITLDPVTAHSWVVDAMPFLVPAIGFLMVSRFKYAHATNALFGERKTFGFLVLVLFAGALVMWRADILIPLVMIAYVASGPLAWVRAKLRRAPAAPAAAAPAEDDDEVI